MAIETGTRFGSYEVAEAIGAGGMGEVYRATDTTLERDVALKVLPASFAEDAERVTRFEREAKTLAALNHPNIAQIYGLEKSDGTTALVMELVDGATLEERIAKGPIPADEALGIAMQIADALEAAHGQNIVHRDLKPANIKLKQDGTVKVLDFGIAKALAPESLTSEPQSPIMTTPATQVGVILGTAAYMSPEQAKGKAIDQRTDIWAFGCVLYEMLTGQLAFGAEDVPTTLARIIANDTNLDTLPATVSPAVRQTIKLCLEKDVRERVRDIGDVKLALGGAFEPDFMRSVAPVAVVQPLWRRVLPVTATAAIAVVSTAAAVWLTMRPGPLPVNRFDFDLPEGQGFRFTGRRVIDFSPDGRRFVYNTDDGLYLRAMGELVPQLIPGTETDARSPSFSPDGQAVVYWDGDTRQLKRIGVSGGSAVVIAPVADNVHGLSWAVDDTILIGQIEGVYRVAATGGTPELIIPTEDGLQIYGARLLPGGESVLFSIGPAGEWDAANVVVQSLSTGERIVLVEGGNDARYLPTGHIVYAFGDGLFAVAFDLENTAVLGGVVPLVQGVMRASGNQTGVANYAVSEEGGLIYVSATGFEDRRTLLWIDRDGVEEVINVPPRGHLFAQLSPDESRVALSTTDDEFDIWIWDLERETLQRLTFDPGTNIGPIWSADGQRVAFNKEVNGIGEIFWQAADGSGMAEPLTESSGFDVVPTDLSPDGAMLLYHAFNNPSDVWMVPIEGPTAGPTPLLETPADERSASLSPDGRWLTYQSDESGRDEIYVRPFPDTDSGRWQVSTGGGRSPIWSRDGNELFYYVDEQGPTASFMAVSVETDPSFRVGTPQLLFRGEYPNPAAEGPFYDVSSDGQRFLILTNENAEAQGQRPQVIVVQNWLEELERLVPTE